MESKYAHRAHGVAQSFTEFTLYIVILLANDVFDHNGHKEFTKNTTNLCETLSYPVSSVGVLTLQFSPSSTSKFSSSS